RQFRLPAAVLALFGHKSPKPLAAEDNAFALQFLISAFDGDDADEQILGELAERGQRDARLDAALADLAFEAFHDLLVEGAAGGGRDRAKNELLAYVLH